ncbi:MAG: CPBP family intramembrane metalloprotease [Oscillospiraceae bacterium]|jgi:membrane protease YdiL (CAAX protease family)|nr:CPBP family intramembrane metalloprotease [Oscillospiraceae bacterium]
MQKYSILRHIWRAIYPLLIWLGITFISSFLLIFVITLVYIIRDGLEGDMLIAAINSFQIEQGLAIVLMVNVLCSCVFIPIWVIMKKKLYVYENAKLKVTPVVLTLLSFISFNIIVSIILGFIDIDQFFPTYIEVADILGSGTLLMQILSIGILAPIMEEVLSRGIILNRLLQWMPKWIAILVSAALFAVIHFNLLQSLYAFVIGVAFAFVYLRYRNLWIPIIGHIAFNTTSIIFIEILDTTGADPNPWLLLIPATFISILSVVLMLKVTKPASLAQKSDVVINNVQT